MAGLKNLPPTARKFRKAREQGDVARSPLMSGIAVITIGFIATFFLFPTGAELYEFILTILMMINDPSPDKMALCFQEAGETLARVMLPIFAAVFGIGILIEVAQVGFLVSPEAVSFRLSRLNLGKGLARVFGFDGAEHGFPGRIFYDAFKPTLAVVLALGVVSYGLWAERTVVLGSGGVFVHELRKLLEVLKTVFASLSAVLLVLAAVDLLMVRFLQRRRLQMDRDEFRQEMRENEGSPEIRGMRRQLQHELLLRRIPERVRRAQVVIVGRRRTR